MKDKKNLYPILLLLISVASIYYLVQFRYDAGASYDQYLSDARNAAKSGVESTALENYQKAIELNSSDTLYYEVGKMYMDLEDYWNAKSWYESEMIYAYPKSVLTYKLGIEQSIAREDYEDLFEAYQTFKDRELESDEIEDLITPYANEFVLSDSYDDVGAFSNLIALAPVYTEDYGWEYIDDDGYTIISDNYQKADVFSEYAAIVDENGNPYFVDQEGNIVISGLNLSDVNDDIEEITEFRDYSDDLILARSNKGWGFYNSKTYELVYGHFEDAAYYSNGVAAVTRDGKKWALLGSDGSEITGYDYNSIVSDYKGCICRTNIIFAEKERNYYLINNEGQPVSKQHYGRVKAFNDNTLAAVNKEGKWLFVNGDGEEKDLGSFQEAESFSNGLAAVKNNGMWGYIDMEGNLVVDYQFEEARPMSPYGAAFVKVSSGKWRRLKFYYYKYNK